MTHYRRVGRVPPKRHTVARDDAGNRLLEELMGSEGFSGSSSLLYHRASPSALVSIDALHDGREPLVANHPVTPMHVRTQELTDSERDAPGQDLVGGRAVVAGNDDVVIAVVDGGVSSPLYRNAAGDEVVFILEGSADLRSTFGTMPVGAGDYVVIPAGTTHQWVPHGNVRALVLESTGHVRTPRRYLTDDGQFRPGTPYCERDLRTAPDPLLDPDGSRDVVVRTRHGLSLHRHEHSPFDVVGWDGGLYPYALSIHDFEPIVGSLHQPPPVHQTFEGTHFVVCSFVPRPFDFHPDAVKIPYHHANVDSDEVLFYVGGNFMSRAGAGIEIGSLTLHPAGFVHGPQPGSWERSVDATRTDETAVMIDTFAPLSLAPTAMQAADPTYLSSWR
ncbi:MAG: homogentisate 1,2-dioxygenase [Aquihabitans sp.]